MKQDKGQGTIRAYLGKSASFFYYKRLLLLLAVLVLLIIALAVWTAASPTMKRWDISMWRIWNCWKTAYVKFTTMRIRNR